MTLHAGSSLAADGYGGRLRGAVTVTVRRGRVNLDPPASVAY
jgi:hypothetical protein